LLGTLPVFNIHPSLLPAFRGLHAVQDAIQAGARILGATLHLVDHDLDTGNIVAQIASGRPFFGPFSTGEKISFLHKVYLILLLCELEQAFGMTVQLANRSVTFSSAPAHSLAASPSLSNPVLKAAFADLQDAEGIHVID
jgi:hypothetical protein